MRRLLAATVACAALASAATAQAPSTACGIVYGTGSYAVSDGKIIGPNGQPFVANGVAVYGDVDLQTAVPGLIATPGLNFVRITCFDLNAANAAYLTPYILQLRSAGIVVEVQDTNYPNVLTGSSLTSAEQWYSSIASEFKGDSGVWFDTQNEPTGGDVTDDQNEITGIYNAIRATGNNSIVMMDPGGNTIPGMSESAFASMTNVVWDEHYYNWEAGYSTDVATNKAKLLSDVANFQTITSANGTIPVIVGEYGNSTDGSNVDPGGMETVQAVQDSVTGGQTSGSVAWEWYNSGTEADAVMTAASGGQANGPYGQEILNFLASSPSPCGQTVSAALQSQPTTATPVATPAATSTQQCAAPTTAAEQGAEKALNAAYSDVASLLQQNAGGGTVGSNANPTPTKDQFATAQEQLAQAQALICIASTNSPLPTQTSTSPVTAAPPPQAITPGNGSFSVGRDTYTIDPKNNDAAAINGQAINGGAYQTAQLMHGSDGHIYGQSSAPDNYGQWEELSSDGSYWIPLGGAP